MSDEQRSETSADTDLPPVSSELVAMRLLTEAHWRSLKPAARLRFHKELEQLLSELEDEPIRIRPVAQHAAVEAARGRARAWIGRMMREVVRKG